MQKRRHAGRRVRRAVAGAKRAGFGTAVQNEPTFIGACGGTGVCGWWKRPDSPARQKKKCAATPRPAMSYRPAFPVLSRIRAFLDPGREAPRIPQHHRSPINKHASLPEIRCLDPAACKRGTAVPYAAACGLDPKNTRIRDGTGHPAVPGGGGLGVPPLPPRMSVPRSAET